MQIALLGASSQIARDLILSYRANEQHEFALYGRRPAVIKNWLESVPELSRHHVADLATFNSSERYDAVINFVGIANPAAAAAAGPQILAVTAKVDDMAMAYLEARPNCRYIFISSGAAYCSKFDAPADERTRTSIDINNLQPQDWYGLAKMFAECRHRAHGQLPIIDVRVFSYFSRTQDMSARFLLTDTVRSIRDGTILRISLEQNVRDYLNPRDFCNLIDCLLASELSNTALDCYTLAPVDKLALLKAMQEKFSLQYEFWGPDAAVNATGAKPNYYSLSRRAAAFGYAPTMSSVEGVFLETEAYLGRWSQSMTGQLHE